MSDLETFAPIRIDGQGTTGPSDACVAYIPTNDTQTEGFWRQPLMCPTPDDNPLRQLLAPVDGSAYRMTPMSHILEVLNIKHEPTPYLDDSAMVSLGVKLRRLGLCLATNITGQLRLRLSDTVPIVNIDQPQASKYSSITVCLYLIAWMLQVDPVTPRDLTIADDWIDGYDPKSDWAPAAKGTLRWLLARKLVLTHKRKQRMGKVKRYPNVRNRLLTLLLSLVSDPQHATPKRMRRLETIYSTLGLDPADIHADMHRLSTTASLQKRDTAQKAHIDPSILRQMSHNTQQAQQILANVFVEPSEVPTSADTPAQNPLMPIIRRLAAQEQWRRSEVEAMAKENNMTIGAMLERINDFAFELTDDALADDDNDVIYIDQDIARQCLSK